ncbi:MAG: monovalent cation/H+ antiporter subunit D family protein [Planctomycetes bacterium]|nr:monovalent cation/H+ antiporter subunit D family protein [Planctomycetota bacterium]
MTAGVLRNLPALVVIVPLFMGLVTAILGRQGRAHWLALATAWVTFGLTGLLAYEVLQSPLGFVTYTFGPWADAVPLNLAARPGAVATPGIEYRVDHLNALFLVIVAGMTAIVILGARLSLKKEIPEDRRHVFYGVLLLCLTGLLGITITGDAFNLYVLLEISSLTAYALVAMGKSRDKRALTASFHYLLLGTVGASLILIGIGYLFMVTGTLNMTEMARILQEEIPRRNKTVSTAFALLLAGFGLKAALFPLHAWLPNAYTYSPSVVSTFLASTATKVGLYAGLRFYFTIFGADYTISTFANEALLFLACAAILHGSVMAIQQTNVKRLLAYSSVAQIGYLVIGFCLVDASGHPIESGVTGSLLHVANHAVVKGALFVAAGAVVYRCGAVHLDDLRGLARKMPLTFTAFAVGGLSLIGVPLTGGFISKWHIVSGAIEGGYYPVVAVILIGSLLAVVYVLRMIEPMVFGKPEEGPQVGEAPPSVILPAWILIGISIYFGVNGGALRELVEGAAKTIAGGGS